MEKPVAGFAVAVGVGFALCLTYALRLSNAPEPERGRAVSPASPAPLPYTRPANSLPPDDPSGPRFETFNGNPPPDLTRVPMTSATVAASWTVSWTNKREIEARYGPPTRAKKYQDRGEFSEERWEYDAPDGTLWLVFDFAGNIKICQVRERP